MKINGAPATSGDPSAVVGLREGKNTISIEVRSQDGARQATYTIAVDAFAQEAYVKASNASGGSEFGVAVALSSDGTTLAVGARNESGKGVGINGDQTISLALLSQNPR